MRSWFPEVTDMSSFTDRLIVMAVPSTPQGLARFLPPGLRRPAWEVVYDFSYAVGSSRQPIEVIDVPYGFQFDGASVPLPFRILVPMAHPDYIQAAALHDWMLTCGRWPRRYCDLVFYEALGVLGMPALWRAIMFGAVRIGAIGWHLRRLTGKARHAR
jgi:uncharacterized protein DUF1353